VVGVADSQVEASRLVNADEVHIRVAYCFGSDLRRSTACALTGDTDDHPERPCLPTHHCPCKDERHDRVWSSPLDSSIIEFRHGQEADLLTAKQRQHHCMTFSWRAAGLIIGLMI
jgi:hypothetical protein